MPMKRQYKSAAEWFPTTGLVEGEYARPNIFYGQERLDAVFGLRSPLFFCHIYPPFTFCITDTEDCSKWMSWILAGARTGALRGDGNRPRKRQIYPNPLCDLSAAFRRSQGFSKSFLVPSADKSSWMFAPFAKPGAVTITLSCTADAGVSFQSPGR